MTLPSYVYIGFLLALLIIAGAAEYLHIAPANTFYTVFILVIGLIAPSPAFPHGQITQALQENTQATKENTLTQKELDHG